MQKIILPTGLTIIYEKKKTNSVVIEVMIKVGSNFELPEERGISHFIEHMLFEGTKKRPTNWHISNEIEKIGGDFNAYTTNERTCFYVKLLKKHFNIGVDVLADLIQNSLFKKSDLEKEKKVVIKEIDMVHDEPRYYQWDLLLKNLFKNHPTKNPVYGDKKIIKGLSREKVLKYFNRYYVPNNMVISVVGDIPNWKDEIVKKFTLKKGKNIYRKTIKEPLAKKNISKKEKRDIASTYLAMGFKTVPLKHKDSYVLEVINGILGRGQSGRMFTEIRSKMGLAYEVGTRHTAEVSYGYFSVYASVNKTKLPLAKKMILQEFKKLQLLNAQDLKEAKTYIEGEYLLELEDSQKVADQILFYEQAGDAKSMKEFIKRIKKVTISDIKRVSKKYFKNHTVAIIEGR